MSAKIWPLEGGSYLIEGRRKCVTVHVAPCIRGGSAADWANALRRQAQTIDDACEEADGPKGGIPRDETTAVAGASQ